MKPAPAAIVAAVAVGLALLIGSAARAEVKTKEIDYQDGDTALRGYLAYDDSAQGKRPAVLIVHEWYGLNAYAKKRAEQLAKLGYVAFALDMYGQGVLAKDAKEASGFAAQYKDDRQKMRRRAAAGLDVLKKQEQVDVSKVAAIGYCFGGTTVLELARSGADLSGVVSFHGGLGTPSPAGQGQVKAKVLVLHGADDPFVPDKEIAAFREEMRTSGADWQFVVYGGAVHSFTNPEADKAKIQGARYDEKADRRSWQAMQDFFDEIFGPDHRPGVKRLSAR